MKSKCLDYRTLPGQNQLSLSYLFEPEKVRPFYPEPVTDLSDLSRLADTVHKRPGIPANQLYSTLAEFHHGLGAGERTAENLQLLKSESAVAVVAGQQVGILGGPALTVYKALTVVRLAADLSRSGIPAVPVFWMASQDSDFEEIRSTYVYSHKGDLVHLKYPDHRGSSNQMVGTIPLDSGNTILSDLERFLEPFDGTGEGLELLSDSYRSGDFRTAFARWLIRLFQDYGLVILDPTADFGDLGEFYQIAIEKRLEIIERLDKRTDSLEEAGFSIQVHVPQDESLLFLVEGNNRYKLAFRNGYYRAKDLPEAMFTPDELIRKIDSAEGMLSPSALLRPILQDYLLPTMVTIGGPAEIAYFGQLNAISEFWQAETPILSRCGFTIVDRKVQKFLMKWDLSVEQVLTNSRESIVESVFRKGDLAQILYDLEKTERDLKTAIRSLGRDIKKEDPTVASMLNSSSKKIFYQINKVRKRLISNREIRDSDTSRQVSYLMNQLMPRKQLQERVVNFASFFECEGKKLLDNLVMEAEPFNRSHKIFYL